MTDVSLLVEWESVQGAEYYVLTYYPKNDEGAQEQVGFSTLIISVSNTGCSKKKSILPISSYKLILINCILDFGRQHRELLPHHRTDSWGYLHCPSTCGG